MGTQSEVMFRIPDTLMYWPWPRKINPHHEEVKAVSDAWFRSLKAFGPEAQRFIGFSRVPDSNKRTPSHYNAPAEAVHLYAEVVMDAVNNPTSQMWAIASAWQDRVLCLQVVFGDPFDPWESSPKLQSSTGSTSTDHLMEMINDLTLEFSNVHGQGQRIGLIRGYLQYKANVIC
ncbi:hypothetical protein IW262DRAFT_1485227 [Armillaria fumosa]|nr:hypothetical protein IW262DRAFT_1485227 [Armillaria fumosa]